VYNEDISSVRIASGYTVTFYIDDNFQGSTLTKTADDSCFVDDGWNDQITSMRIQQGTPTSPPDALGDVDNSGSIAIIDALLIAQYYVGLNPENFDQRRADTNCDGSINILDALLVAQYYVGLINSFC